MFVNMSFVTIVNVVNTVKNICLNYSLGAAPGP